MPNSKAPNDPKTTQLVSIWPLYSSQMAIWATKYGISWTRLDANKILYLYGQKQ